VTLLTIIFGVLGLLVFVEILQAYLNARRIRRADAAAKRFRLVRGGRR
jgi:hypothetical protein